MACGQLDPAIIAALPSGGEILTVEPHGNTRWSDGFKVVVQVGDGKKEYFLKIVKVAEWVDMARAEYESQKALAAVIPEHVIEPVAWGLLQPGDDAGAAGTATASFFLARFRHMREDLPPLSDFMAIVQRLQRNSVSPTGQFGFHCTTYCGPPPINTAWTDSWEAFWGRQFQSDIAVAQRRHGHDEELAQLATAFVDKVVARLLRPLQTGGRVLRPVLCHGDLWDGNVQIDAATGQAILFDSCAFYGHGEMDLQSIGDPRYRLQMDVVHMYKTRIGASEPVDDFDDRHRLYAIRNDLCLAACGSKWKSLLEVVKERMREFLAQFPDGYEGFQEQEQSEFGPFD